MEDNTNQIVVNPKTGEQYSIPADGIAGAKEKGYVLPEEYKPAPPPDLTNINTADLTPDNMLRVFNPNTGEEIHVQPDGSLTQINQIRDKGYVLASDAKLDQQSAQKDQEAQQRVDKSTEQEGLLGLKGTDVDTFHALLNPQQTVLGGDIQKATADIYKRFTGKDAPPQQAEEVTRDAIRQVLHDHGYDTVENPVEVALANMGNNVFADALKAAMGVNDERWQRSLDKQNEQHPVAHWVGSGLREAITAVASGEMGNAAGAASKLSGAARLGVAGVAMAAPNVAVDILNGNGKQAAEDIALGGVGNILMHGLFSLAGKAAPEAATRSSAVLDQAAADVWKNAGTLPNEVSALKAETQRLVQQGIINSNATVEDNLQKLQTIQTEARVKSALKELDTVTDKQSLIGNLLVDARKQIFDIAKNPALGDASKEVQLGLTPWVNKIDAAIKQPSYQGLRNIENYMASKLGNNDTPLSQTKQQVFDLFQNAKTNAENAAITKLNVPEVGNILAQARMRATITDMIEEAIPEVRSGRTLRTNINELMDNPANHGDLPATLQALGISPTSVPTQSAKIFGDNANKTLQAVQKNAVAAVAKITGQQQEKIEQGVKQLFATLANGKTATAETISLGHALNSFVPNNGVGLSTDQKINRIRKDVIMAETNPNITIDHLATVTQPLHDAGLTQVAQAYTDHQMRLMKVIQTIIPKDPAMGQAHPFSANVEPAEISAATKTKLNRALTVAAQPEKLLEMVKSNNITPLDVAICAAVNPETLQRMRTAVVNEALKSKPDLSYQQRLSMGILMGTNIDQSTVPMPALQNVYVPQPIMGGNGGGKGKLSAKASENITDSYLTVSQKALQTGQ